MKKYVLLILIGILFFSNQTFSLDKEQIKENIRNLKKEDFRKFFSNYKKQKAIDENLKQYLAKNRVIVKKDQTCSIQRNLLSELPEDRRFPAEFEEVQAILIGWPYYSFDKEQKIQYPLEQLFEGKALYYDFANQQYKLIDVVNIPDVFDDSEYAMIYAQLADAIQKEAQVWINVWAAEDTTEILNYMQKVGKPLYNYRFFVYSGNSFWYRDCGPVAFYYGKQDSIAFLDFEYYGGRPLDDQIPQKLANELGIPIYTTTIEFEGGNILVDGDGSLFTTNAIIDENADGEGRFYLDEQSPLGFSVEEKPILTLSQVRDSLVYLFNLKNIKILDKLQYDGGTGHIDLYADFYDENTFVFTKYPNELANFFDAKISKRNIDTLLSLSSRNGKKYMSRNIPLPRKDNGSWYSSSKDYQRYTRTYSNHLFVNKTIIQPVFYSNGNGYKEGYDEAMKALKEAYPGYNIVPIDVRPFDGSGGAIHCITKQIPAENPLRIFHFPIDMSDLSDKGFKINAEIYNHSGIKSAKVLWKKTNETSFNELILQNTEDILFQGFIPAENLSQNDTIEYYISAVANNGKTMTKPIVAPQGTYKFVYNYTSISENVIEREIGELFPNPANEFASFELRNHDLSKITISIMNISGEKIYSNTVDISSQYDIVTINTSKLQVGIYYVIISTNEASSTVRKLSVVR